MKRLSLRPYNGSLYLASSRKEFERGHSKLFKRPDVLNDGQVGRFTGGEGNDGLWTYLVWGGDSPDILAHELSHVVLHVFERCGIDPREGNGEPFCYMLSQLIMDANL
jgi:hypothetical protein